MNVLNKSINYGDTVYARLTVYGETIAEIRKNDASTVEEVIARLRAAATQYTGLTKIYIRNMTQGWAVQFPLLLVKSILQFKSREQLVAEGYCEPNGQLIIQF